MSVFLSYKWCPREDSNLHALRRYHLKVVRLPISPPGHIARCTIRTFLLFQVFFFVSFLIQIFVNYLSGGIFSSETKSQCKCETRRSNETYKHRTYEIVWNNLYCSCVDEIDSNGESEKQNKCSGDLCQNSGCTGIFEVDSVVDNSVACSWRLNAKKADKQSKKKVRKIGDNTVEKLLEITISCFLYCCSEKKKKYKNRYIFTHRSRERITTDTSRVT